MSPLSDAHPRTRFWIITGLAFLALIALVLSLTAIFQTAGTTQDVRETQLEGTPFGKKIQQSIDDIAAVLAILQDCLDPNGVCGKQSAEGTAAIIEQFREDSITAAACADQPGTQTREQIAACVESAGP